MYKPKEDMYDLSSICSIGLMSNFPAENCRTPPFGYLCILLLYIYCIYNQKLIYIDKRLCVRNILDIKILLECSRGVDLQTILGIGLDLDPWVVSRSGSRYVSI